MLREPAKSERVSRFTYHGLSQESFLLLLPKGHPAGVYAEKEDGAKWPLLDPKYLAEETFLLPDTSLRLYENVTNILKMAGIEKPKCAYHALYMETIVRLAEAGTGIAVVSPRFVRNKSVREHVDIYRIPDSYGTYWEASLATLKDSYMSRAAKAFIEEYTRYLGV